MKSPDNPDSPWEHISSPNSLKFQKIKYMISPWKSVCRAEIILRKMMVKVHVKNSDSPWKNILKKSTFKVQTVLRNIFKKIHD